jgi:hypothetical protein
MLMRIVVPLFLLSQVILGSSEHALMRGTEIDIDYFPEAIYIRNTENERCTATLVGKYALLTAAHCVDSNFYIYPVHSNRIVFAAFCENHPRYQGENFDIALCKSDRPIHVRPASISQAHLHIGDKVLLTGYGCSSVDRLAGSDGIFRIGMSTIYQLPLGSDTFFHTYHDATLCAGDSGGASYYPMRNYNVEKHYILGVNARSDFESRSLMTAVFNHDVLKWMRHWSRHYQARICGLNEDCADYIRRPDTPRPFGE